MSNEFSEILDLAKKEIKAFKIKIGNDLKRLGLIHLSNILFPIENKIKN